MTQNQQSNLQQIFDSAQTNQKSLFKLLNIGRKNGFDNFINRKLIWPFLLQLDSKKLKQTPIYQWKGGMSRTSIDYQQLQKDAERSLTSMKTFQSITKFHLKKKQEAVLAVLDSFFANNKQLKYIQGFHDVASVFLILFGNSTGYYLMQKAGRTYFYDFLTFQFGDVGRAMSHIVYELVTLQDPDFKRIYSTYEQTQFLIFILPWILTWFSHNFASVKTICRIWDYLLCTGPHGVLYLTSAIILSTKQQLLANCDELDQPSIQTFYQEQAKKSAIDIEKAIKVAMQLEAKYQISDLQGYKKLNQKSMFRTEVFYKQINIHKKFHESRRYAIKRNEQIKKAAKIIGVAALVFATVYFLKDNPKIRQIGQF